MSKLNDNDNKITTSTNPTIRAFIEEYATKSHIPFTYADLLVESLEKNYGFAYGSLRNCMSLLVKDQVMFKIPKENPDRYYLMNYARLDPQWEKWQKNDKAPKRGTVIRRSLRMQYFERFVQSLGWDRLRYVHNIKIEFGCINPKNVNTANGWERSPLSFSWKKTFSFEFPLIVQCFDNGKVQVSARCSFNPIPLNFEGLSKLICTLGELNGSLSWDNTPNVMDWIVVSWHYGKDSHFEVSGERFNVTFLTWAKTFGRIYLKEELNRVRAEEIKTPHQSIQALFESVVGNNSEEN